MYIGHKFSCSHNIFTHFAVKYSVSPLTAEWFEWKSLKPYYTLAAGPQPKEI